MKVFYRLLTVFLTVVTSYAVSFAQKCDVDVWTDTTLICANKNVMAVAGFFDTVATTFNDDNGQSGNMFDIEAKNDITIRAFDCHPDATTNISIYYRTGSYTNVERDSTKWTLIGRTFNVKANNNGRPTRVPLFFKIDIDKGETYSFYVTSTTSNILNYTNGSKEYDVYASDKNLAVFEGIGVMWPFGGSSTSTGIYRPRIFNGNIVYELQGTKTFKWDNNQTGDKIITSSRDDFTLKVEGTFGACTSVDSIEFKVEKQNINLGKDTFLCDGSAIQLDAGILPTGTNIVWKPSGGNRYKLILGGGQKSVAVTTPIGCIYRDTIEIIDKPSPNVSLGSDIDLCNGDSIVLDAGYFGMLTKYSWNTNDSSRIISVNAGGRYVVTVTDSFGCKGKDNIDVTLRQNPSIDLGGDKEVCEGDTITLDAQYSDNNTSYNWSNAANTQTIDITNTNGYKVNVTSEFGCESEDSVYYFFHGAPRSGLDMKQEACKGDEVTLDAGHHGPGTKYEWSTAESSREIKVTQNGDYTLLITDSFGCTNEETINLNFRKLPRVNLGLDVNFCDGDSATLDAGFDDGYTTYKWSNSETIKTLVVTKTGTYTVTVTDSFGCINSDEVEVLVLDLPKFAWEGDTAICDGETIELDPGNHNKYQWSTNETSRTITVGPGTYGVIITNVFGCTNQEEIEVSTFPNAIADFAGNDIGGQKIEFNNSSTNADSYAWDFGDGNTSTDMAPTHWYKEEGTYTVKLTASNRCGENESTNSITVEASSLNELLNAKILIYPNPNNGLLYATVPNSQEDVQIQVFDLSGKELSVRSQLSSSNTLQIELPATAKGIYALRVTTKTGVATQNFVVE